MSNVVESKRQDNIFTKFINARKLASYTVSITKNKKIFSIEYSAALEFDIVESAKRIFIDAWEANDVYVSSYEDWKERERLQLSSIRACNRLLALIQLARSVYHLKSSRVEYWSKLTVQSKEDLRTWHTNDKKRYTAIYPKDNSSI